MIILKYSLAIFILRRLFVFHEGSALLFLMAGKEGASCQQ